jgi:hypothetical protein
LPAAAIVAEPSQPARSLCPAPGGRSSSQISRAITIIRKSRPPHPNCLFVGGDDWQALALAKDHVGRHLVNTGSLRPLSSAGLTRAVEYGHITGEVAGLSLIPWWAFPAGQIYVVRGDDHLVLDTGPATFGFQAQESGPQTVRLAVWGVATAVTARQPDAICGALTGVTAS